MKHEYDILVLGGGIAGLTAALYAARGGKKTAVIERGEAGGQLTLADTLPDETDMEADCEQRADAARLRSMVEQLPGRERQIMRLRYGFGGAAQTQQQTAQTLHISRSYV